MSHVSKDAVCPKCGGSVIETGHGPYCPKDTCKWGWECEMDGSPLKPPIGAHSVLHCQIERIVTKSNWRGTPSAMFQKHDGWIICDAFFDGGEPRLQIRSLVQSTEEAAIVATGIQMAIDWIVEQTALGNNVRRDPPINS